MSFEDSLNTNACPYCNAIISDKAEECPHCCRLVELGRKEFYDIDNRKSRVVASLLGIFTGGLGLHRFYLGYYKTGALLLLFTILTGGIGFFWGLGEGIAIFFDTCITTDSRGYPLK